MGTVTGTITGGNDCLMNYLTGSDYSITPNAVIGIDEIRFCTSFSGVSSSLLTIMTMLRGVWGECVQLYTLGRALIGGNVAHILGQQSMNVYLTQRLAGVGQPLNEIVQLIGLCVATLLLDLLCSAHHYVLTYYRVTS